MTLGYAWFDSYDNVGYVLTLHIFPPYSLTQEYVANPMGSRELNHEPEFTQVTY